MTGVTAKGTALSKSGGNTLVISAVEVLADHSLLVGAAFQGNNPPTTVTWGNRNLKKIGQRLDNPNTFGVTLWIARPHQTRTQDITVTWASGPGARCMFASVIDRVVNKDDIARSLSNNTGAPSVGPTGVLSDDDDFVMACFASAGPDNNDTPGTPASGWTAGQRIGTNGAPPVSNITIQEVYRDVTTTSAVTASMTGATSRDWASIVVPLRTSTRDNQVLFMHSQQYANLITDNAAGQDAVKVFFSGCYYNSTLPATPSPEILTELSMNQTEYDAAITLLENEGVIEPVIAGVLTPKGYTQ